LISGATHSCNTSVAKRPKFQLQNSKGAAKKFEMTGKLAAEFLQDFIDVHKFV
jgi:hypothetical protein